MDANIENMKKEAYRAGFSVLVLLAVLTVGEYLLGSIAVGWWAPLVGTSLLKAFFIVRDYMHLPRLFAGEEEQE
ncbi:MAG: cytochrome C oxidase subunit IV family protein [Anaerolineales bacterium]|nr:cytochrome C oxidase subunit IV family protein [Anaerolineales bacterium]